MTNRVVISADSTCDLSGELLERFQIKIVPLTITLGEDSFPDDGRFLPDDMYRRYRADGTLPQTSAPGLQQYVDFFAGLTADGCSVVHLTISSELSASYANACVAAEGMDDVHVVDSRMLSTGVGLLAIEGAEARDRGMDAAEIAALLRSMTGKVQTSFVLDTLEFMRKGGRCSGVAAFGANLLRIKPALKMQEGKLEVYKKYRGGMEHVYRRYISEHLSGKRVRPGHVFLTDSGEVSEDTIEELAELVRSITEAREIHHTTAGCTVSSHCGPKTLGVLFIEE